MFSEATSSQLALPHTYSSVFIFRSSADRVGRYVRIVVSADAAGRRSMDAPRGSSRVGIYGQYHSGNGEMRLLSHL